MHVPDLPSSAAPVGVFAYARHFLHQLVDAHPPSAPLQIELHSGVHCDLYRCPHCYGFGQASGNRRTIGAQDFLDALDSLPECSPVVILSGITTDPMTHPEAVALIRGIRARGLPLGLYTKGVRLDQEVRRALIEPAGGAPTWVTLSLDAADSPSYLRRHNIPATARDGFSDSQGSDYFELVCANLTALRHERDEIGSATELRAAFLLFDEGDLQEEVRAAIVRFAPLADLLRFALPQYRNDGAPPGNLPSDPQRALAALVREHGNAQVRILLDTASPTRDESFTLCRTQRFQVTIDRSGNVYPCPQVAVQPYKHLIVGNILETPLHTILEGELRRRLFDLDIDSGMRCRICDRKDEALNRELHDLAAAFAG